MLLCESYVRGCCLHVAMHAAGEPRCMHPEKGYDGIRMHHGEMASQPTYRTYTQLTSSYKFWTSQLIS